MKTTPRLPTGGIQVRPISDTSPLPNRSPTGRSPTGAGALPGVGHSVGLQGLSSSLDKSLCARQHGVPVCSSKQLRAYGIIPLYYLVQWNHQLCHSTSGENHNLLASMSTSDMVGVGGTTVHNRHPRRVASRHTCRARSGAPNPMYTYVCTRVWVWAMGVGFCKIHWNPAIRK
jgi:hypothetical protein